MCSFWCLIVTSSPPPLIPPSPLSRFLLEAPTICYCGHNLLLLSHGVGQYTQLGTTLDDAMGERVGRGAVLLLSHGVGQYTQLGTTLDGAMGEHDFWGWTCRGREGGGAAVEALAREGNRERFKFTVLLACVKSCDRSVSGIKANVARCMSPLSVYPRMLLVPPLPAPIQANLARCMFPLSVPSLVLLLPLASSSLYPPIQVPLARVKSCDFSFSGLKANVARCIQKEAPEQEMPMLHLQSRVQRAIHVCERESHSHAIREVSQVASPPPLLLPLSLGSVSEQEVAVLHLQSRVQRAMKGFVLILFEHPFPFKSGGPSPLLPLIRGSGVQPSRPHADSSSLRAVGGESRVPSAPPLSLLPSCAFFALPSHLPTNQVMAGGVASNQVVRTRIAAVCEQSGLRLVCPPPRLCTDNGEFGGRERGGEKEGRLLC
ncbi:unnamed protein product [Closterium sp. Naga37s-1]|nr:unnamed protein product [Closterium sp. Naga37s-1]